MSAVPAARATSATLPLAASFALMQHHDMVAVIDLIDQMRRPEYADAFGFSPAGGSCQDAGARLDVEPDGRLVEQQQRRAVQQRPRDFDTAHLAARQAARLVMQPAAHIDRAQELLDALPAPRLRQSRAARRGRRGFERR